MSQTQEPQTSTAVVAKRIRSLRDGRGMSAAQLAKLCQEAGAEHLDRSIIANIENGRRQSISIEEVLVLALVLDVAPVHLFVPVNEEAMTVGKWVLGSGRVREWTRGTYALPSQDRKRYFTEVPDEEWQPPEPRRQATGAELRALMTGEDE